MSLSHGMGCVQLAAAGCAPPFLECESPCAAQPCSVWALAGCSFTCRCSWDGLSSPRAARAITVNCQMQLLGHLIDLYLKCPLEREPSGDAGNVKMINPLLPIALLQNRNCTGVRAAPCLLQGRAESSWALLLVCSLSCSPQHCAQTPHSSAACLWTPCRASLPSLWCGTRHQTHLVQPDVTK